VNGLRDWLREFGHQAEVSLVSDIQTTDYDIVHIQGIMRPYETWAQLANARRQGTPVVVTPCYQDLARYNRVGRRGVGRLLFNAFGMSGERLEWMRSLGVGFRRCPYRVAAAHQRRVGFSALQRRIVKLADGMVFSSKGEQGAVAGFLGDPAGLCVLIPNGIAPLSTADPLLFTKKFGLKEYVLCAGRIEDLKNQLGLLSALRDVGVDVVLAGAFNRRHRGYGRAVNRKLRSKRSWHYVGYLSGELLRSCYAAAAVHVQPSWFENFGLATLEALAVGTPAVLTSAGYAGSHLGHTVSYCDPAEGSTITTAIEKEMARETGSLESSVARFEWPRLMPRYIAFYRRILSVCRTEGCDVI